MTIVVLDSVMSEIIAECVCAIASSGKPRSALTKSTAPGFDQHALVGFPDLRSIEKIIDDVGR